VSAFYRRKRMKSNVTTSFTLLGFLVAAACAQSVDGTYKATETWSATLTYWHFGSPPATGPRVSSGTQTGTIVITNGQYTTVDQSGVSWDSGGLDLKSRTCYWDGFNYEISGSYVFAPVYGSTAKGLVFLGCFVVSVPLVDGEVPIFWDYDEYSANGTSLSAIAGGGDMIGDKLTVTVSSTVSLQKAVGPPTILEQPHSQTVLAGEDATFTVVAGGDPPLSYVWRKGGSPLPGGTAPSLTLTNVKASDAGTYSVVVTNAGGKATSTNAILTVNPLPPAWLESFESASIGSYVPSRTNLISFVGDQGRWVVGDTISHDPDCGPEGNHVDITAANGGKVVLLVSAPTDSSCAKNVWIAADGRFNCSFPIPLLRSSQISFFEQGWLSDPQWNGLFDCILRPCGDTVYLKVTDNRINVLLYIFQRATNYVEHVFTNGPAGSGYRELFLDPAGGTFTRNLYDDLADFAGPAGPGTDIMSLEFSIGSTGWATLGDLRIGSEVYTDDAAPTITTSSPLPAGMVGVPYRQWLAASGGATPYTWSIVSGTLPSGMSLSSSGLISGTPSAATIAKFTVKVTGNNGLSSTKAFSLTVGSGATVTLHRLTSPAIVAHATDALDAPLDVTTVPSILLKQPPLGGGDPAAWGLVADGVTPLLIKVHGQPAAATSYHIELTPYGGTVDLSSSLRVLTNGAFLPGSEVELSPSATDGFAVLSGIDREALTFQPGSTEMRIEVSLFNGCQILATTSFKLRRPPVVLVHGIGSTAAWEFSSSFLNELYKTYATDFVIPVEYGVINGSDDPAYLNKVEPLTNCAWMLDKALWPALESSSSFVRCNWAFTRYDIVGHSQGGVILRYLAQPNASRWFLPDFRNSDNFWRGRFDRILTIGAPHNGSLNYFYSYACKEYGRGLRIMCPIVDDSASYALFNGDGNEKFDPFREEMQAINSASAATDAGARFHCVRTRIYGGKPPDRDPCQTPPATPMAYWTLDYPVPETFYPVSLFQTLWPGLPTPSVVRRGNIVIPEGSDGVVDFDSQRGGCDSNKNVSEVTGDIAHMVHFWKVNPLLAALAPTLWFFGCELYYGDGIFDRNLACLFNVCSDCSQIDSPIVAGHVASLLSGTKDRFGPFINATVRPATLMNAIIAIVRAPTTTIAGAIQTSPSGIDTNGLRCSIQSDSNPPLDGSVVWSAVHYGNAGVDTAGFTLQTDISNTNGVVLSITPGLIGEIALWAEYRDTNGNSVFAAPVRAYRDNGGASLTSISLGETNVSLSPGQFTITTLSGLYNDGTSRLLLTLPGDALTYSSTDTNVAAFFSDGSIRALKPGSCTVAVTFSGLSASVNVDVVPSNDNFIRRQGISTGWTQGSNLNATKEAGEPDHAGNAGGRSVWFSWTAPKAGQCIIDTTGSDFDTLLAVYTNASLAQLEPVASNNDSGNNRTSQVSFNVVAGTEYQIAVDGFNGACGSINLGLLLTPAGAPRITSQPLDQTGANGSNVTFSVTASGSAPLNYQWMKEGVGSLTNSGRIKGANSASLTIGNLEYADAAGYFVVITNQASSVTSTVARLKVVPEMVPPTLTITNLAPWQRISNALFVAQGKAADNVAVSNVQWRLNGMGWQLAQGTNAWSTAPLNLNARTNLLEAYAGDTAGNPSLTQRVNFIYVMTNRLLVSATGKGTLSPNYSNSWLEIGRNYSMKATAGSGFAFTNWVISTNWAGSATTNNATVQFMMQSNLTLQVNFADVTKPTITISSPTAGQKMTNAVANVRGTASDNWRVGSVQYQLNGGAWGLATSANGWTNWTAVLPLTAGTNVIKAYAVDLGGNASMTNTVSVVSSNTFNLRLGFRSAQPMTSDGLHLSLEVSLGISGRIEVSTNLEDWTTLTNFASTNATMQFRDSTVTNYHWRFYRAVAP
jgi:hypothetical protein